MKRRLIPSWEDVQNLAEQLEFRFEDYTRSDDGDGVYISKFGGVDGWFQDSEAGRVAAYEWLEHERAAWEEAEQWRREHGQ